MHFSQWTLDLRKACEHTDDRPDGEDIIDPAPDNIRASLSRAIKASSFSLSCGMSDKGCREDGYAAAGGGATGYEGCREDGCAAAGGGATEYAAESKPRPPPPAVGTSPWSPLRACKSVMIFGWEPCVSLSDLSM